jgi:DNA polymerase III subunit beta
VELSAKAGAMASALALATSAMRGVKKMTMPVRLVAAGDVISIICADKHASLCIRIPATIIEPGESMMPAGRLAALTAGFAAGTMIKITTSETGATVACGNSKYRLPSIPAVYMPQDIVIDDAIAEISIAGDDALLLFEPLYATGDEETRFNLAGVFLQSVEGQLVSVATDGSRLCRVSILANDFSPGRDLTIPTKSAATLRRIVNQMKPAMVTLRRSVGLIAVSSNNFTFTARLIRGNYPAYERVVPATSQTTAACARADLLAAATRLAVIAASDQPTPLLALAWASAGPMRVALARQPSDGDDAIEAEASGVARFAVPLSQFVETLNEFKVDRIRLASGVGPLVIQGEGCTHGEKLALLMPSAWNFGGWADRE